MSIATQITRLNNNIKNMKATKQEIKDAINNDFDIIANEQIEDYAELIEDGLELYKDCIPSVETEQATEITVDDAMKYGRNKLQLFGNTEQAQYSGKNLLKPGTTKTENGITFSVQEDGTIIANGTATANVSINLGTKDGSLIDLPAGTYTISGCPSNGSSTTYRMGTNLGGGNIFDYGNGVTTTLASDVTDKRIWCIVYSGVTVNNLVFKPMLEIGDAKTDYEPYVGGVPSPNPDYPQDIHVVTGDNTVEVQGKNLAESHANGTYSSQYQVSLYIDADFKIGQKYALSFIDKSIGNQYYRNENLMLNPSSYSIITTGERQTYYFECKNNDKTNNKVYTSGKGYIILKNSTALENLPQFQDVQIEEVTSYNIPATSYEPYYHREYPINLGDIELCKIGDYQDYLYKENGNWYKYEAINKKTLNGTESWIKSSKSTVNRYAARYIIQNEKTILNSQSIDILSQYFVAITPTQSDNSKIGISKYNDTGVMINFDLSNTDFDTLEKFTSWLANNNSMLYYVLATPTSTQITDETLISQLNAIYEHLQLEKGTNTITVTASDLKPYMKLSYKNYESNLTNE